MDFKKIVSDNWVEPPKRERKRKYAFYVTEFDPFCTEFSLSSVKTWLSFAVSYSESEYFKQTMRQSGPARPKEPRIPRMPQL